MPQANHGSVVDGTYRSAFFQFTYQIPFGWVERTDELGLDSETDRSKVLLAVFERPPAATGKTVNAAAIIAAERVASYPGLKTAADYFGPLAEITKSKGFKVVNEPYDFPVDAKPIVRQDFIKDRGSAVLHQSSMAILSKGYVLSFTFLAGSDEDVTELIEKLKFGPVRDHSLVK